MGRVVRLLPLRYKSFLPAAVFTAAVQNLGWLVVERFGRLIFSVMIGFLVARYLGPSQFGQLSYALALVGIGLAAAEAGVSGVVRRDIVQVPSQAAAVIASAWRLRLIAGSACYLLLCVWALWGEPNPESRALLLLCGLLLFQPALAVADLWLQANLRSKLAVRAQLVALTVGGAARVALVLVDAPLLSFAGAALLEAAVAVILLNVVVPKEGSFRLGGAWDAPMARRLWCQSWPLMLSGLTVLIYIRIDLVMLRHMTDEHVVGIYAAAVRISELWFFLPGAVASSYLPSLLRARETGAIAYQNALQKLLDGNAGLAYAVAVPTVFLAPSIVRAAYGAEFAASGPILAVLGWTVVLAAIGVVRGQFCVNEGLTRLHLLSTAAGALLNVTLNLILIPRFGGVGAGWATFASQALAAWLTSFFFAPTRGCAHMQTRALLIPFRWVGYLRSP